jgi:hypothetical protein
MLAAQPAVALTSQALIFRYPAIPNPDNNFQIVAIVSKIRKLFEAPFNIVV